MRQTRAALIDAVRGVLGCATPDPRPRPPATGIYALPEWQERVAERHARYDDLWRDKGI